MSEPLPVLLAGLGGLMLGALYFGGLWWTIRQALPSKVPGLWFLGSLLLRTGLALLGFYAIGAGNWERLVAALVGFVVGRMVVTLVTRTRQEVSRAT